MTDWYPLGAVSYRKWNVYDMGWSEKDDEELKLENYIVSGAQYGGPIARILDQRKCTLPADQKLMLKICTSAGKDLCEISWVDEVIVGMGWSDQEHLIIVMENGYAQLLDITGQKIIKFQLLSSSLPVNIVECHFWGNGIAAIADDGVIYIAEGLSANDIVSKGTRIYALHTGLGKDLYCTAMAIVPPLMSRSGLLEVLIATSNNSVLVVHEAETNNIVEDQLLQHKLPAPITKIAVAPNGRFLACYRKDGVLTVLSSTFSTKVLDFDTKSISRPIEISWCGEDAVVMQWKNTGIIMVGPYGDWLNFPYDSAMHVVAEPDCCRIITATNCEILQRVPSSTVAIRSVGSTDPAALMFDAMEAFEDGDPKSDENIRAIAASGQLADAVQACILAASAEFDVDRQQSLLKAASYGKAFCPDVDPNDFVDTAKKLRVLNAVRDIEIGLPLTMQQYNRLTPEVLVGRLTMRNHHFLALKICELLKLRNERVFIHWACEKVKKLSKTAKTDEEINYIIKKQLKQINIKISCLAIAEAAYSMGRKNLATFLLDQEEQPGDQIPLLLKMNAEELALQKAINSRDIDLIYYTLINLETRFNLAHFMQGSNKKMENFYRMIYSYPEAFNLLKIYYRGKVTGKNRQELENLLVFNKNFIEVGIITIQQALKQDSQSEKYTFLKEAIKYFVHGKGDLNFYRQLTEEQIDLLELHRNLEMRCQTSKDFSNLTVIQTIKELVQLSVDEPVEARWVEAEIQKMVKKFKLSEKIVWYQKVACYSKKGAWNLLFKLANEKKSPIGYRCFAEACIKHNQPSSETEKYVDKLSSYEEKYEFYSILGNWRKATDAAVKLKDPNRLQEIGRNCTDGDLQRQIHDLLSKMY